MKGLGFRAISFVLEPPIKVLMGNDMLVLHQLWRKSYDLVHSWYCKQREGHLLLSRIRAS